MASPDPAPPEPTAADTATLLAAVARLADQDAARAHEAARAARSYLAFAAAWWLAGQIVLVAAVAADPYLVTGDGADVVGLLVTLGGILGATAAVALVTVAVTAAAALREPAQAGGPLALLEGLTIAGPATGRPTTPAQLLDAVATAHAQRRRHTAHRLARLAVARTAWLATTLLVVAELVLALVALVVVALD